MTLRKSQTKIPSQSLEFNFRAPELSVQVTETVVIAHSEPIVAPAPQVPTEPEILVYSVCDLVQEAGKTLERKFAQVWVEGEISNLSTPRSGHIYFTLKDESAQLSVVAFRNDAARIKFALSDGLKVRVRGRLSIFAGQGKFQLYADRVEPAGLGEQQIAFELLKQKLAAEGLFDQARKRPLPRWPRCIGLVTSPTGAVIRDVLRIARRRGPARFVIAPCQVQGDAAPREMIAALRLLERLGEADVIILCRGGGSAEDLAAFNHEELARTIASLNIPVVSGVGHEVDFTIADFVADLRASTPSAAAELVVPLFAEAASRLEETHTRLLRAGRRATADARQHIDVLMDQATAALRRDVGQKRRMHDEAGKQLLRLHPRSQLAQNRREFESLTHRLREHTRTATERRRQSFATLAGKLDAMSPLRVLERGYSLTLSADNRLIAAADPALLGSQITVKLAKGALIGRVTEVLASNESKAKK